LFVALIDYSYANIQVGAQVRNSPCRLIGARIYDLAYNSSLSEFTVCKNEEEKSLFIFIEAADSNSWQEINASAYFNISDKVVLSGYGIRPGSGNFMGNLSLHNASITPNKNVVYSVSDILTSQNSSSSISFVRKDCISYYNHTLGSGGLPVVNVMAGETGVNLSIHADMLSGSIAVIKNAGKVKAANLVNLGYTYQFRFPGLDNASVLSSIAYSGSLEKARVYIFSGQWRELDAYWIDASHNLAYFYVQDGFTYAVLGKRKPGNPEDCSDAWKCDSWSACKPDGFKTRQCEITSTCKGSKPATSLPCVYVAPAKYLPKPVPEPAVDATPVQEPSLRENLFDIGGEIIGGPEVSGGTLTLRVFLLNFGSSRKVTANVKYVITDSNGHEFHSSSDDVLVSVQNEYIKEIDVSNYPEGNYHMRMILSYPGQLEPAESALEFSVVEGGDWLLIALIAILCLFGIAYFHYRSRRPVTCL
jgi:hypothetical protein